MPAQPEESRYGRTYRPLLSDTTASPKTAGDRASLHLDGDETDAAQLTHVQARHPLSSVISVSPQITSGPVSSLNLDLGDYTLSCVGVEG